MNFRPYVICHMLTSIDNKVTGKFLSSDAGRAGAEDYYRIHREFEADAFACGRVTMEGSFTGGYYPDLTAFADCGTIPHEDYISDASVTAERFACAFDRKGRLGWKEAVIHDEDPGYDSCHVIEILTDNVTDEILAYYQSIGVSYIFAGREEMDVSLALEKLIDHFGIKTLLLEGGSVLDGAFLEDEVIDELSLVTVPVLAQETDRPLFDRPGTAGFRLMSARETDSGCLWVRYHSTGPESQPCLKLKTVAEAIEMADDFMEYYYDLETGQLESRMLDEDLEPNDGFIELLETDPERFVRMPDRFDLHNSPYSDYKMMEAFVETQEMYKNKLGRAIQGKGAFRRFREAVAQLYLLDDWYQFQNTFRLEAARWWCRREGWHYE